MSQMQRSIGLGRKPEPESSLGYSEMLLVNLFAVALLLDSSGFDGCQFFPQFDLSFGLDHALEAVVNFVEDGFAVEGEVFVSKLFA